MTSSHSVSETVPSLAPSAWGLSRVEIRAGLIVFLLALIARFPALLPGYSIDDYLFATQGLPKWFDPVSAMNGRALGYTLYAGLARLGADPPGAGVLYVLLLTAALIVTGIAACRMWKITEFGASLLVLGFVALHPYQAEMFTFRTATMVASIPLLLSMAAVLACARSRAHWIGAVLLLTFAVSIYQVVLSYLALLLLFAMAFQYVESGGPFRKILRANGQQIALIAASVVLYLIFAFIVSYISGVQLGSRTTPIGLRETGRRLMEAGYGIGSLALYNEAVAPLATKLVLIATFLFGFAACAFHAFRGREQRSRRRLAAALVSGVAGAPLCLGVSLLLRDFSLAPRAVAQTSLYLAGMAALLFVSAAPQVRRVLTAGTAVAFFSFIGLNEHILTDQLRVNARDRAEANRILMRLEMLPDFKQLRTVVLSGGSPLHAARVRSVQGDLNISARFADWSKVSLLNESTGYAFAEPSAAEKTRARQVCSTRAKWPAPEAVSAEGGVGIVCLPED